MRRLSAAAAKRRRWAHSLGLAGLDNYWTDLARIEAVAEDTTWAVAAARGGGSLNALGGDPTDDAWTEVPQVSRAMAA